MGGPRLKSRGPYGRIYNATGRSRNTGKGMNHIENRRNAIDRRDIVIERTRVYCGPAQWISRDNASRESRSRSVARASDRSSERKLILERSFNEVLDEEN